MKRRTGRRVILLLPVLALGIIMTASSAFAAQLDEVRDAIRAHGKKWVAEETTISKLPDHEKPRRLGLLKHGRTGTEPVLTSQEPLVGLPLTVDWRPYATPVRDQGSCGSCWAFATAAALESSLLLTDHLPGVNDDRAEEILLGCSGAGSCNGGYISDASDYLQGTGLPPESYFPYTAGATDDRCSSAVLGWETATRQIGAWAYVTTIAADLAAIKTALATYGPLVTTMEVYGDFFYYRGGVYEYTAGTYQGAHAILLVGYADDATKAGGGYFTVKNSWGTGWGSEGYFYIAYSELTSPVAFGEWTIAYTPVAAPPPAPACSYGLTPASASFSAAPGTGTVSVTTSPGCPWTATSNVSWISVKTALASGTDSGSVTYSVARNTGSSRTGTLTVAGATFTATQAGGGKKK